jgi:hypothetical protein
MCVEREDPEEGRDQTAVLTTSPLHPCFNLERFDQIGQRLTVNHWNDLVSLEIGAWADLEPHLCHTFRPLHDPMVAHPHTIRRGSPRLRPRRQPAATQPRSRASSALLLLNRLGWRLATAASDRERLITR